MNKLSSVLQAFHNQTWQLWGCAVAVCTTMTCIWVCSCLLLFWVADVVTCSCQCSTCSIGAPVMSTFIIGQTTFRDCLFLFSLYMEASRTLMSIHARTCKNMCNVSALSGCSRFSSHHSTSDHLLLECAVRTPKQLVTCERDHETGWTRTVVGFVRQ